VETEQERKKRERKEDETNASAEWRQRHGIWQGLARHPVVVVDDSLRQCFVEFQDNKERTSHHQGFYMAFVYALVLLSKKASTQRVLRKGRAEVPVKKKI